MDRIDRSTSRLTAGTPTQMADPQRPAQSPSSGGAGSTPHGLTRLQQQRRRSSEDVDTGDLPPYSPPRFSGIGAQRASQPQASTSASPLPGAAGQWPELQQPHVEQLHRAQEILRAEGAAQYPRLVAAAWRAHIDLRQFVDQQGQLTDHGKDVEKKAKWDRRLDRGKRVAGYAFVGATLGLGVMATSIGKSFRDAGERLTRTPDDIFDPQYQPSTPFQPLQAPQDAGVMSRPPESDDEGRP